MEQTLCKTCSGPITSEWRRDKKTIFSSPLLYCCRSCCNKKTITDQTKNKISESLLRNYSAISKHQRFEDRKCLDCDKIISVNKVTPPYKGRCPQCRSIRKKNKEDLYYEGTFIEDECVICKKNFKRSIKNGKMPLCSPKCKGLHKMQKNDANRKELFKNGKIKYRRFIRRILIETKGHVCVICHNTEWNSQPIPIQVDHIDGNAANNFPDNLRMVCYNCAAQLPTFSGRNRGRGRKSRGLKAYE